MIRRPVSRKRFGADAVVRTTAAPWSQEAAEFFTDYPVTRAEIYQWAMDANFGAATVQKWFACVAPMNVFFFDYMLPLLVERYPRLDLERAARVRGQLMAARKRGKPREPALRSEPAETNGHAAPEPEPVLFEKLVELMTAASDHLSAEQRVELTRILIR